MALRGNTQSFKLEELFQSLYTSLSSGILSIAQGKSSRKIYFQNGDLLLIPSQLDIPWLGQILVRQELMSLKDLEISLQEQKVLKIPLIDIIVDKDLLSFTQISQAIQNKLMEELFEIFVWKEAFFEFQDSDQEKLNTLPPHISYNTNNLIMEASRRSDEWGRIYQLLPSFKLLFEVKGSISPSSKELERLLIEHYQKHQPLQTFLEETFFSKFESCLTTYYLLKENRLQILPPEDLKNSFNKALLEKRYSQAIYCLEAADDSSSDLLSLSRMQTALFSDRDFIPDPHAYRISLKREKWSLTHLFLTLFLKKHTGLLTIQDPLNTTYIYFDEEKIHIRSQGEDVGETFGDFLFSRGVLTRQQLDLLQTQEKIKHIPLVEGALQLELLTQSAIIQLWKEKILEEIATIVLWNKPYCEFAKNYSPPFLQNPLPTDTLLPLKSSPDLYKELINELIQWGDLLEKIHSSKTLFQKLNKSLPVPLDEETQEIFKGIDGTRSLQDFFSASTQSPLKICRHLFQLLNRGLIQPLTLEELKQGAEKALIENNPSLCLKYCEYAFEEGLESEFFQKIWEKMQLKNIHFLESSETYKLEGDLKSVNLAELFQSFHNGKQSGFFQLRSGSRELFLHFVRGNIYYQEISAFPIPPEQLKARETNALHQLLAIFFWKDATFSFTKNYYLKNFYEPSPNTCTFKFETPVILMKSLKMFEEWDEITKQIPSMYSIFIRPHLLPTNDSFLAFFTGSLNLNDILEKTGYDNFSICSQVHRYCQIGELFLLNKYDAYQFANQFLEEKNYQLALKYYWHIQSLETSNKEVQKIIRLIEKELAPPTTSNSFSGVWNPTQAQYFFGELSTHFVSGLLEFSSGKRFYFSPAELWFFSEQPNWLEEVKHYFISHQFLNKVQFQEAVQTRPRYATVLQNLLARHTLNRAQMVSSAYDLGVSYLLRLFSETGMTYTYKPHYFPEPNEIGQAISVKIQMVPFLQKILSLCKNLPNEVQLSKLPQMGDLIMESVEGV